TPGIEIANAKTLVALSDYGNSPSFGSTTPVTVHVPALSGGFAYTNIHLDYDLKGRTGYTKTANGMNYDATNTTSPPSIVYNQTYAFSDTAGGGDTTQSENVFKKNPGVGGLVVKNATADPVRN